MLPTVKFNSCRSERSYEIDLCACGGIIGAKKSKRKIVKDFAVKSTADFLFTFAAQLDRIYRRSFLFGN